MTPKTIVLAAGGTGGHVFPAAALAEQLLKRKYRVCVFTDDRGSAFAWGDGVEKYTLPIEKLSGSIAQRIKGYLAVLSCIRFARTKLQKIQPDLVVGFGGYSSIATLAAARLSRKVPMMLHQADAYLGRANKLFLPFVDILATTFSRTEGIPECYRSKIVQTGLPLRENIRYAVYPSFKDGFTLLVTGGSQGAQIFGQIVPRALKKLAPEDQAKLRIFHQCRPEFRADIEAQYAELNCREVKLSPFFEDMQGCYARSHLVLCRAGASSVLEAAAVGRPAIFVPYPYATNDHQAYNARQAEVASGGWCVPQGEFTETCLLKLLKNFMKSPWKLEDASVKIRTTVKANAAVCLADCVESMVNPLFERQKAA